MNTRGITQGVPQEQEKQISLLALSLKACSINIDWDPKPVDGFGAGGRVDMPAFSPLVQLAREGGALALP